MDIAAIGAYRWLYSVCKYMVFLKSSVGFQFQTSGAQRIGTLSEGRRGLQSSARGIGGIRGPSIKQDGTNEKKGEEKGLG